MGSTATTKLTFKIYKGTQLVREQVLVQNVIKLGKVSSAHVMIDDESVSRMHAIIEVNAKGDVSIIDLGSTRGTYVNGQKINKATLRSGDVLTIGDARIELAMASVATVSVVPASLAPAALPPPVPMVMPAAAMSATVATMAPVANRAAPAAQKLVTPVTAVAPVRNTTPATTNSEEITGAKAIEVAALLGDSVVDVKHVMDPKAKVSTATKAMFAIGAAALATSAVAFGMSVSTASKNKQGLEYWTRTLHKPSHAFRLEQSSTGLDVSAAGGGAIGLLGVTLGLARMRREKKNNVSYRIGTAPGVELPLENTPTADYPLVAPKGDDFVFNYAPGMEGEMTIDGVSTPLSQCAGTPSTTVAGAIELPIPAKAKIRTKQGGTTIIVSAVNKPVEQSNPLFNVEGRTLKYAAGSLAAHLGAVMLLNLVPVEDSSPNFTLGTTEDILAKMNNTEKEDPNKEKPEDKGDKGDQGDKGQGGKMAFEAGVSGHDKGQTDKGKLRVSGDKSELTLAREEAREAAKSAGILGSTREIQTAIQAITGTADISQWTGDINSYGSINGPEGDARGTGFGDHGSGRGGGCPLGVSSCGIVGSGKYNTIGDGDGTGPGYRIGGGNGHDRGHKVEIPNPVGKPTATGDLDREIIKRYVRRESAKISYCYEHELLAKPDLTGEMTVTFIINGDGTVSGAKGTGLDGTVASCVADVVGRINFPHPTNGGVVQVNYPFNFRRVGG